MGRQKCSDVVVILPGITGSALEKNGKEIWGLSAGAFWNGITSAGKSIDLLRLDDDDVHAEDIGDGIEATRVLPDLHLIPGLWKIDGYGEIERKLLQSIELVEGKNFFKFPYDWRRDNRVSARRLHKNAQQWLSQWRESSGNPHAKLIILAHSMGGLVARHYLEVLGGWRESRALITFGTPYAGSINAIKGLASGFQLLGGLVDASSTLRSFTSVYQLLPTYACVDSGGVLKKVSDTTVAIPELDQQRAKTAWDFHKEIDNAVSENVTQSYYKEQFKIYPVVGTEQNTLQSAVLSKGNIEYLSSIEGDDDGGDGTVPRISAYPTEFKDYSSGVFVADRHGSLQNSNAVLTQVFGIISGRGIRRRSMRDYRHNVRLDLDDAYPQDALVEVGATVVEGESKLIGSLTNLDNGTKETYEFNNSDMGKILTTRLEVGAYRLVVSSIDGDTVNPATDTFVVYGNAS